MGPSEVSKAEVWSEWGRERCFGLHSRRHLTGPPLDSLPGAEAARGETWQGRDGRCGAGGQPPGGGRAARDSAARHVRRRRPWREASPAAEAAPRRRTTATGVGWRPPSSAAGGTSGSRWARRGQRRGPPKRRRTRRPVPWRGCRWVAATGRGGPRGRAGRGAPLGRPWGPRRARAWVCPVLQPFRAASSPGNNGRAETPRRWPLVLRRGTDGRGGTHRRGGAPLTGRVILTSSTPPKRVLVLERPDVIQEKRRPRQTLWVAWGSLQRLCSQRLSPQVQGPEPLGATSPPPRRKHSAMTLWLFSHRVFQAPTLTLHWEVTGASRGDRPQELYTWFIVKLFRQMGKWRDEKFLRNY